MNTKHENVIYDEIHDEIHTEKSEINLFELLEILWRKKVTMLLILMFFGGLIGLVIIKKSDHPSSSDSKQNFQINFEGIENKQYPKLPNKTIENRRLRSNRD